MRRRHCGAQHDSAAVVQARSTAQHVAGAFGHRRGSKTKPIEGLGLTRAETLVSAASAGLARVDWCRDTTLNPFPWALCLLVWVASHEISQHQPVPKSVPVSAAIRAHGRRQRTLSSISTLEILHHILESPLFQPVWNGASSEAVSSVANGLPPSGQSLSDQASQTRCLRGKNDFAAKKACGQKNRVQLRSACYIQLALSLLAAST